jgi:phage gp16-like protein
MTLEYWRSNSYLLAMKSIYFKVKLKKRERGKPSLRRLQKVLVDQRQEAQATRRLDIALVGQAI